jgi:vacuolar-type H+-ATPase subunit B/Vma2
LSARYPPYNLFDRKLDTAWVEGAADFGKGEWIEVKFEEPIYLSALGIMNGYTKSEDIYKANNRIKKLKIEFETGREEKEIVTSEEVVTLEDKNFSKFDEKFYGRFVSILFTEFDSEVRSAFHRLRKIRFTILEVHEGTTYNDTCISEIFFLGSPLPGR